MKRFSGGPNNENIAVTVADTLDANDVLTDRKITISLASPSAYKLYYQVQMFYNNGGGPFVISCQWVVILMR